MGIINRLTQIIWNTSIKLLKEESSPAYSINSYLAYEELKVWSQKLLIHDIISSENIIYSKHYDFISSNIFNMNHNEKIENIIIDLLNENKFNISANQTYLDQFDAFSRIYLLLNLNFPLNIDGLLKLIEKQDSNFDVSPSIKRLIWLNNLAKKENLSINKQDFYEKANLIYDKANKYRDKKASKYPLKLLILVEGATEEKLLPIFASKAGIDFDKKGIQLIAAGGKNQVSKLYKKYCQNLNLPIFVILDADAKEISEELKLILRENDQLFVIQEGEFEDILSTKLICKSINTFHGMITQVHQTEIKTDNSMTSLLDKLWKEKGLGDFDKIKFARIIAENIRTKRDISPTLNQIIEIISKMIF